MSSTRPNDAQIDALLAFLPLFEVDKLEAGRWRGEEGFFPYFEPSDNTRAFVDALYENEWIVPFDWPSWQDQAENYFEHPEQIAFADVETIRKLFTTHVRKDRFCDGHLASMLESGHIVAILRRLKKIRGSPLIRE